MHRKGIERDVNPSGNQAHILFFHYLFAHRAECIIAHMMFCFTL